MSQEDVETLRAVYDAGNRGDWDAALRGVHPDFEWKTAASFPLAGPYRGRKQVVTFLEGLREPFEEAVTEPEEFFERGDQIVAFVLNRLRPRGSSATLEDRIAHLWTIRDGKASRCEVFLEREKALEAAGLSE